MQQSSRLRHALWAQPFGHSCGADPKKGQKNWKVLFLKQPGNVSRPQRLLLGLLHGPGFIFPSALLFLPGRTRKFGNAAGLQTGSSLFPCSGDKGKSIILRKHCILYTESHDFPSLSHIKLATWPFFLMLVHILLGRKSAFYLANVSSEHCEQIRIRSPGIFPNRF